MREAWVIENPEGKFFSGIKNAQARGERTWVDLPDARLYRDKMLATKTLYVMDLDLVQAQVTKVVAVNRRGE